MNNLFSADSANSGLQIYDQVADLTQLTHQRIISACLCAVPEHALSAKSGLRILRPGVSRAGSEHCDW